MQLDMACLMGFGEILIFDKYSHAPAGGLISRAKLYILCSSQPTGCCSDVELPRLWSWSLSILLSAFEIFLTLTCFFNLDEH